MAIDVTALIVLGLFFFRGYTRGFIVAAFSVVAILLGILVAMKMSQSFATWLLSKGYTTVVWAPMLSYLLLFVGVVIVVRLIAKLLQKFAEGILLGTVNRLLGGFVFAIVGAILFSTILWISVRMNLVTKEQTTTSITYRFFSQVAPYFFSLAGHLLPFAKNVFEKLQQFFDATGKK